MTSVDPRIENRRDDVRRQRRRSLFVRLGIVGAVALLLLVAFGLTRSPLLDVDRLTIEGSDQVDTDSVVSASGVAPGDPMTDVDLGRAESDLESLPWVATADVGREWPSTVTIELTERTPVAVVSTGDGDLLAVDVDGRVLQSVDEPGTLLSLVGVEAVEPGEFIDAAPLLEIAGALPVELALRISGAAGNGSDVELALLPSGTVRFGPVNGIEDKFLALRSVLAQVDHRCLADIDLRVAKRPTVTRDSGCIPPAEPGSADAVAVDDESAEIGSSVRIDDGAAANSPAPISEAIEGESLSESGFPVHPVTGLPYDPAVGMQWDPVTGQPVDPVTGQGYDPPALG